MDGNTILTAAVSILAGGGTVGGILTWLKERKKDNASALLTNVEALQKQVILLKDMQDYLRRENSQLVIDRDAAYDRERTMRRKLTEVQEELDAVSRTATQAQNQVAILSERVKVLANGGGLH